MTHGLFSAISFLHLKTVYKIKEVADLLISFNSALTNLLLKLIDRNRMDHATSAVEQMNEINELQILQHIEDVKNDAVKLGAWSEEHEGQLNILGNLLYNEHDWEVDEIHRYIHEVIALGPNPDA